MVSGENISDIQAGNHPLEDIAFLEETFDMKSWHTRLVFPDASPASRQALQDTQQSLDSRHFITKTGMDDDGKPVLHVYHLGQGTSSLDILHELGPLRGAAKLIMHPLIPMSSAGRFIHRKVEWIDHSLHDPARANGVVNLTAEAILLPSGKFNGKGVEQQWKFRKNWLQSLSYVPFITQSALYAFVAKNNDDMSVSRLQSKLQRIERQHGKIVDITFNKATDKEHDDSFHRFLRFVRKYPIQIGGALDDLGMLLYMGHTIEQKKWDKAILDGTNPHIAQTPENMDRAQKYLYGEPGKKPFGFLSGFVRDFSSAVVSIVAWTLMMLPRIPRTGDMYEAHKNNPFAQSWDRFRENPQTVAGSMTVVSSLLRATGAWTKNNKVQAFGESVYIGGDAALFFTKNDEYGNERSKDIDRLAEKLAQQVNNMPYLFGPQAEQAFITNISEYLKQKSLEEIGGDLKKTGLTMNDINERSQHLARATLRYSVGGSRYEKFAYRMVEIVNLFPESERPAMRKQLSQTLSGMPWMEATPQELEQALTNSPNSKTVTNKPGVVGDQHAITTELGHALEIMPGIDAGVAATSLYHTLLPFMRANAQIGELPIHGVTPQETPQAFPTHTTSHNHIPSTTLQHGATHQSTVIPVHDDLALLQ